MVSLTVEPGPCFREEEHTGDVPFSWPWGQGTRGQLHDLLAGAASSGLSGSVASPPQFPGWGLWKEVTALQPTSQGSGALLPSSKREYPRELLGNLGDWSAVWSSYVFTYPMTRVGQQRRGVCLSSAL